MPTNPFDERHINPIYARGRTNERAISLHTNDTLQHREPNLNGFLSGPPPSVGSTTSTQSLNNPGAGAGGDLAGSTSGDVAVTQTGLSTSQLETILGVMIVACVLLILFIVRKLLKRRKARKK